MGKLKMFDERIAGYIKKAIGETTDSSVIKELKKEKFNYERHCGCDFAIKDGGEERIVLTGFGATLNTNGEMYSNKEHWFGVSEESGIKIDYAVTRAVIKQYEKSLGFEERTFQEEDGIGAK